MIEVCVCERCGHAVYPFRHVCPECAARAWRVEHVDDGTLEQATTIRQRIGVERRVPNRVGSVRLDLGPVVITRVLDGAEVGARVALAKSAGAVVARPLSTRPLRTCRGSDPRT